MLTCPIILKCIALTTLHSYNKFGDPEFYIRKCLCRKFDKLQDAFRGGSNPLHVAIFKTGSIIALHLIALFTIRPDPDIRLPEIA